MGKTYIAYKNDDGQIKSGYFDLIEISDSFVKFSTGTNILTIPMHMVLKIKEGQR